MAISRHLVPPGGWKYKKDKIVFEGETFDDLVNIVRDHRVSNKLPYDNVEKEIENQIATLYPQIVINV